jgi:predicted GIY-YIG superfamily endonuclease
MPQLLLLPDPRPLVERLGVAFFREAPDCAGVYLMRDKADTVLYVGKAKNLRKRLASYRVANPDRMPRRHLRLLRAVERIEFEACADEASALARESELLRMLRPRFNRAGTWTGPPCFLGWRLSEAGIELAVHPAVEEGWYCRGPLGAGAHPLCAALVRLLWSAIHHERGLVGMPPGWFRGRYRQVAVIPRHGLSQTTIEEASACLAAVFEGVAEVLVEWIRARSSAQTHPFEVAFREADLKTLIEYSVHWSSVAGKQAPPGVLDPPIQPGRA